MKLPRRMINVSLRTQFIVPIAVMLVLSMLVISGYLIRRQSESIMRELETRGQTISRMLAINAEGPVLFESTHELDDLLKVLGQFDDVQYGMIFDRDGRALAHTGMKPSTLKMQPAALDADADSSDSRNTEYYEDSSGHQLLVIHENILTHKSAVNPENLGVTGGVDNSASGDEQAEVIGSLEIGLSVVNVNNTIEEAQMAVIFLTVFVLLFAVLVIAVIVSAITNPITELVAATDQISRGDLSRQVEIDRGDEIGQLANTFNSMVVSLRQTRDEIAKYNRTLEEKIIERTHQLEEAQNALIQSEKMSAIGQLAAGVAHELNNPLGGILGYAQFTLEKLQKNVPENTTAKEIDSYARYVTDIEVQARRCKQIVQNLLRFSRSSRTMEFMPVDLNKVIEETVTFMGHQLHMNQIELTLELEPALPLVQGNAGQLQQVFTNLIINAMHASQAGAALTIASRYSPAVGEFGGAVELLVVDHGHGIPSENLKKIFEPFFTTKEVGKGTGLGLSVSYGIIKEHGGEITVSSTVGKGTTFTVILPVQKIGVSTDKSPETQGLQF